MRPFQSPALAWIVLACLFAPGMQALDPRKSLTQYSRTVWTQEHGLPQDSIRAMVQSKDGYLWLGTDEGLARFDGYEFVIFNKSNLDLPSNSITALESGKDGSLWIGTSNGLTQYRDKRFRTFTTEHGLPENGITSLFMDQSGTLWISAGIYLTRYDNGKFTTISPGPGMPMASGRIVREDAKHRLWVAGFNGVMSMEDGKFRQVIEGSRIEGILASLWCDRHDNVWIGTSMGLVQRSASGKVRRFTQRDGLPNDLVRAIWEDRDGSLWVGTSMGLARMAGDRFYASNLDTRDADQVRCLYEDREGDLWVGANNGLVRLRDDVFTVYGKTEGLPGDEPNTVFQDRIGRIWVGYHEGGLVLFSHDSYRVYGPKDGMPDTEVFNIRQTAKDDLLMSTRSGVVKLRGGRFTTIAAPGAGGRRVVYDALEDSAGRMWLATYDGLLELRGSEFRTVIPGGPLLAGAPVTLAEGRDGTLWAGFHNRGLWRVHNGDMRQFTSADGLGSEQIRSLRMDADGILWIGTFGGGLGAYRGNRFYRFTEKDGLLSDNIAGILDHGDALWLSTTRGICRIEKRQLKEFMESKRATLEPVNYTAADGLRSAQCSPGYPIGGGGHVTADGRLWFTTSRGLAVFDPNAQHRPGQVPLVHLTEMRLDGMAVDLARPQSLPPGSKRLQIRYTALYLSAPERVRYSYRLEGLDADWIRAVNRRVINYNSLKHGQYRFTVRAEVPGAPASEQSYSFELMPHFYETAWFQLLCAAAVAAGAWGCYQLRLRQIRSRFALVLQERARLAREIHDTLAQGFVGICSQLDAVALSMPKEETPSRTFLEMARRMARHSLTEARRSVMDLRASVLEGQDLANALESGARMWTAGSPVKVDLDLTGTRNGLPQEMEQHLLRIAQEAVANVLKHAGATQILIKLHMEARKLYLRIIDNGQGFDQQNAFASQVGHFGLIGMRERAERIGGELRLATHPGEGTEVEVTVPLP